MQCKPVQAIASLWLLKKEDRNGKDGNVPNRLRDSYLLAF